MTDEPTTDSLHDPATKGPSPAREGIRLAATLAVLMVSLLPLGAIVATTATGIAATTIKFWDKAQSVRAGKAWRLHRGRSSAILIFFVGAFCMNIGELVKGVATATSTSEAHAKAAITAVFDQVASAIAKGEEISIPGFGKFSVKDRPERSGRNPATGEAITIAASKKVSFTPAKGLKDKL